MANQLNITLNSFDFFCALTGLAEAWGEAKDCPNDTQCTGAEWYQEEMIRITKTGYSNKTK